MSNEDKIIQTAQKMSFLLGNACGAMTGILDQSDADMRFNIEKLLRYLSQHIDNIYYDKKQDEI